MHLAIVSCDEAKARDAPRIVEPRFESRLRGAARPDGHTVVELGNPFMPRAKSAWSALDFEFSLEFCVAYR